MKNVLELEPILKEGYAPYQVSSLSDILDAIEHNRKMYSHHTKIRIKFSADIENDKSKKLMITRALTSRLGFEYENCSMKHEIYVKYRGYTRWVYFKDGLPVWFDSAGSGTDNPSHKCSWPSEIYNTLEFDEVKKIRIDGTSELGKRGEKLGTKMGIS